MILSIHEADDPEYRDFVIDYVRKYFSKALFTKEELLLLMPTHHFGPQLRKRETDFLNPMASKEGCCGDMDDERPHNTLTLDRPCVRKDAVDIEKRYHLKELEEQLPDPSGERWQCLGWVNLNFRSPRMARAFLIHCVNRVLKENTKVIFKGMCPMCQRLKRTPNAVECMWCV